MIGYKGFDKDWKCLKKQYAVGETFEEPEAIMCESGMHFCENPVDVLGYYQPCDENGNIQHFAEVEADEAVTDDGVKYVTKKLKIKADLGIRGLCKAALEFAKEKAETIKKRSGAVTNGYWSGAVTNGNCSGAVTNGDRSGAVTNGNCSGAVTNGNWSGAVTNGYCSGAVTNGYRSGAVTNGDRSGAVTNGNCSGAVTNGYWSGAVTNGNCSGAVTNGDWSGAVTNGDWSGAVTNGNCSGAVTNGNWSGATANGKNSVAACFGIESNARAALGNFIVLSEWEEKENGEWNLANVKAFKVDGKRIKADTFYQLKDGEAIEWKEEES